MDEFLVEGVGFVQFDRETEEVVQFTVTKLDGDVLVMTLSAVGGRIAIEGQVTNEQGEIAEIPFEND